MSEGSSKIQVDISQGIATITLNATQRLNALSVEDYDDFANSLREIDKRDDVIATIWQASGDWFCTGTNFKESKYSKLTVRDQFREKAVSANTDCARALYTHSKILVAALNGPAMGLAAAFLGNFDFIYALPKAWLYIAFPFLGIVIEGGASVSFVNRMGLSKANEVLMFNKKKSAQELLDCGFINKIFPPQTTELFHATVRKHVLSELDGLDRTSVLTIKALLKAGLSEKNNPDGVNLRESYALAEILATGAPARRFETIALKEIKHKL